jgi:hypothetical protein
MTSPSSAAIAESVETLPAKNTLRSRVIRSRFEHDDFFGHQPASTSDLPDPRPLVENLTRCVIEILAGARDLEQIARWVSDDVYRHLLNPKCKVGSPRCWQQLWIPATSLGIKPSSCMLNTL